jgi:hypothetical protein
MGKGQRKTENKKLEIKLSIQVDVSEEISEFHLSFILDLIECRHHFYLLFSMCVLMDHIYI